LPACILNSDFLSFETALLNWIENVKLQIANALTLARIVMIPLVVLCFYLPYSWGKSAAAMLFIAAAVTDSLDGYLARKLNQMSALGAFWIRLPTSWWWRLPHPAVSDNPSICGRSLQPAYPDYRHCGDYCRT
jgi:hypothetical protein